MPRGLGPEEKALWGKVIATVKPIREVRAESEVVPKKKLVVPAQEFGVGHPPDVQGLSGRQSDPKLTSVNPAQTSRGSRLRGNDEKPKPTNSTLDSHWDRRIKRGGLVPDISIDLHDANLSRAYARLDGVLEQAIAQKFKVILLITGKPRSHDRATGDGRGAIAAVVRDWLAASRHARYISAVRNAHPRHGGAGALYIVLKG